ncbi:unnamed protein product [Oppiella nova]|uniref:Inhibitor of growth protein n=1 Tax=Oppiella nova TaxID=334625 RepID=A0A7R9Q8Z2_9ACAR|nr:unnamed protein product [Oppiella nova]CAG2158887.1 unnamed protein product [Oppiella nova]
MREMDLQVHNAMDNLEEQTKQFFSNAKVMKTEQRDLEYDRIKQDYYKTLEDAEEKVHLANQIYELVDKYLRRLDQELQKFKIELEADNSGITEVLERSESLPLGTDTQTGDFPAISTYWAAGNGILSIAQDIYRGTVPNPNPLSSGSGIITSSNITSNRLNSNAFTPLLAVVNANNSNYPNGTNSTTNSSLIPSNASISADKGSPSNSTLPHGSFRCNLGNTAIAAAASQAIAATQQMQQGRRTASLKASYEAINNVGFSNEMPKLSNSLVSGLLWRLSVGLDNLASLSNPIPILSRKFRLLSGNKRSRSSHYSDSTSNSHISVNNSNLFEDNSSEAMTSDNNNGGGGGGAPDWTFDPNEPRYCICNQVSYGDMVACDNEDCQKEWFHYGCVDITQPPKGKWYCPDCSERLNRKKSRKERA